MWSNSDKIKVLFLSQKDFAGSGVKLSQALNNKSNKYQSRFVALNPANFGAENDIVTNDLQFIQKAIDEADIVHLKGDNPPKHFSKLVFHEKVLFQTVGGSSFRKRKGKKLHDFEGLHLSGITPELTEVWIPHSIDVLKNEWKKPTGKIRIGHAPSNRSKKGTSLFLEAIKDFDNVELVLMEGLTNKEVIELKKTLHIFADQFVIPAYGMNAVEALAMGIPVISSCMDIDGCPVYRVAEYTKEAISDAIGQAIKGLNQTASKKAFDWAKKIHSQESACKRLESFYESHKTPYVMKNLVNTEKIEIIKDFPGLAKGEVKVVQKWVARDLIERGIAKVYTAKKTTKK
jgi:hypothetical protein